tara:strand:+ start:17938 stop:19101 length:1164 start_codon:yes stop_codon:yes gene_type:complete
MNLNFEIASGTKVIFGRQSILKLGEECTKLGMNSPMLLTDPGLKSSGAIDIVFESLDKAKINFQLYDKVEANPSDTSIVDANHKFIETGCDSFIAAGGGSTMDTAKAVSVLYANGGKLSDWYGIGNILKSSPPLISIPTTAGTGSEVTNSSIVTDTKLQIKTTVRNDTMFANIAIVDSSLLAKLPKELAAGALMDALTHSIESIGSPKSSPWTEALANKSIELIGRYARKYVDDRSVEESADAISLAATLAGRAFGNTGLGIVHSLAHPLGAYHQLHHGTANGIFLPSVMKFNLPKMKKKYAEINTLLSNDTNNFKNQSELERAEDTIRKVDELARDIEIPKTLRELDITKKNLDVMSKDAVESNQVKTNPVPATEDDLKKLYEQLL